MSPYLMLKFSLAAFNTLSATKLPPPEFSKKPFFFSSFFKKIPFEIECILLVMAYNLEAENSH